MRLSNCKIHMETGFGPAGEVFIGPWKNALEDGLSSRRNDDARTKVTVQVKLLKFNAPAFGFDMETESIAKYQIVARNTGKVIYETEVTATGVAGLNENFPGATRWKKPVNRSGQNNIKAFISRLEAAAPEINKILSSQQFFKKPEFPKPDFSMTFPAKPSGSKTTDFLCRKCSF